MNKIVLSILMLFPILGCETIQNSLKEFRPQELHVGKHIDEVYKQEGLPYKKRLTLDGSTINYYQKKWILVKDNLVIDADTFNHRLYRVSILSFSDREANIATSGKTYRIASAMEDTSNDDLQFKSFSTALSSAMIPLEMKRVNTREKSDYVILVGYGISDPQVEIETTYRPTFRWTPGTTLTTTGYVGNTNFSATSSTPGQLEHTGYIPEVRRYTNYKRYCILYLYDGASISSKKPILLSKVTFESIGSTDDLAPVLGIMFAKYPDYINISTNSKQIIHISTTDPATRVFFSH